MELAHVHVHNDYLPEEVMLALTQPADIASKSLMPSREKSLAVSTVSHDLRITSSFIINIINNQHHHHLSFRVLFAQDNIYTEQTALSLQDQVAVSYYVLIIIHYLHSGVRLSKSSKV